MKIFLSHSSENSNFGNALVDLLIGIGLNGDDIIFTSNDAHGIPIGENIFNWLKKRINEKPFVLYLLSPEYYKSVACLNEMGAAWVVENDHAMIFTPNFDLKSYEFQNGALDPREIGFYINNESRLISFIEKLKESFIITNNPVLINQKVKHFIHEVESFAEIKTISDIKKQKNHTPAKHGDQVEAQTVIQKKSSSTEFDKNNTLSSRFCSDLSSDNLKDEEVLLAKYVIDTDRYKLGTGWQESNEIENIRTWEDINNLNSKLSHSYTSVLRRLEMKKLTVVSDLTSHGNPKEVSLIDKFREELLHPNNEILAKTKDVAERNKKEEFPF